MIDKPLYENPLAGGGSDQLQGDALVKQMQFRMQQRDQKTPAFMAYFKDVMNTKGYPTKTMQDYGSITKQQGPLDLSKINKNPYHSEFIGIGKDQTNLFGYKVPDYVIKEQEEKAKNNPINIYNMTPPGELSGLLLDPQVGDQLNVDAGLLGPKIFDPGAEARRKADEEFLKTADEYQRGFRESEFYKPNAPMTADMAEFIYKSPTGEDITMKGSSSGIGQFGSYLDSIGKGDLLQRAGGVMSAQTPGLQDLAKVEPGLQDLVSPTTPPTPTIPKLDSTKGFPVTVSGDDSIATTATVNPYQEQFTGFSNQLTGFGDQLTGFGDQFGGLDKQFNTINTRLDNVDEGIASLSEQLQPQQQLYNSPYSNFNFSSNSYSNPSPFGLGSLFMRRY